MKNKVAVGLLLRDRLGPEATQGLEDYVDRSGEAWRADVTETCTERIDSRLYRIDENMAKMSNQIAEMKGELVHSLFKFWTGQVVVMVVIFGAIVASMNR